MSEIFAWVWGAGAMAIACYSWYRFTKAVREEKSLRLRYMHLVVERKREAQAPVVMTIECDTTQAQAAIEAMRKSIVELRLETDAHCAAIERRIKPLQPSQRATAIKRNGRGK